MARYSLPEFSVQAANRAGKVLVRFQEDPFVDIGNGLEVVDSWRAGHGYPAQSFYMTVKRHASKIGREDGVAQRIKRMPSIIDKLVREPDMKLSQMQDIAGVRAVVKDIEEVRILQQSLGRAGWEHEALTPKDYITRPKASGYRGIHLRYKYKGLGAKAPYNDLKIEIQIRTQLQHQWATAVEAADAFTRQSIKQSSGDTAWVRFFALMGSIFALQEKCPSIPNTPSSYKDLAKEIQKLNQTHKIARVFSGFATLIPHIEGDIKGSAYFLLTLDPIAGNARIRAYRKEEAKLAQRDYTIAEQRQEKGSLTQIVLVSTSSIKALRRVYPNYFLDTVEFNKLVSKVLAYAEE
jgi:hypothetical protein